MDEDTRTRLCAVADARRRALAVKGEGGAEGASRARLIQEIEALRDRAVLAAAEAADVLGDTDLVLTCQARERPLAAEALLQVSVVDGKGEEAFLDLAVETDGALHAIVDAHRQRETLAHTDIAAADRALLSRWIATLLERFCAPGD
jgi:hypothetical protein